MNHKFTLLRISTIFIFLSLALVAQGSLPVHSAKIGLNEQIPSGLGASDWAQIRALLPSQEAYLKASNTDAGDTFGYRVAISGDTAVVGAPYEASNATGVNGNQANNTFPVSGAAYVFTRSGTTWSQQAYLKASNTGAGDHFGYSVAIDGNTVVVGASGESSNATGVNGNQSDNSAGSSGAAYIFTRSGGIWTQQAYLKASNTAASDLFGQEVAISGATVVVGAMGEDSIATGVNGNQSNNSASGSGAAYVFIRSGTTWSQQAYLKASNTGADDWFGFSVAISGETVVVGSEHEASNATGVNGNQTDNSAVQSGAAYVFVRNGTTWSQQAYLKASNTAAYDWFGTSVTVEGDTVIVGAWGEDSNATGVNGNQDNNSALQSGAGYVFTRSGTTWTQQAYLKASNTDASDAFGYSAAISGDTAVVGAYYEASNTTGVNGNQSDNSAYHAGAAYVFTRSGMNWTQQAYLKASNTESYDSFANSVAISEDTVLVGANQEASNAIGVNGNQTNNLASNSGAAYVFTPPNSAPTNISLSKSSVAENKPVGTVVGTLTTTDADVWDTHTYTFACSAPGADDASFQIVGNSLKTRVVFDYETKNSYAICIRTTDNHGAFFDKNFTIYITDGPETHTDIFYSAGLYDGDILESGENTNVGGVKNASAISFRLGDEAGDKQYRAVLSFNTYKLPDTAVITKVTLKIRRNVVVGTNPFTILGLLKVDIRKPYFGTSKTLLAGDFQAVPGKSAVATFSATPVSNWYSAVIGSAGYPYINLNGITQFRLYFTKDDNDDNGADTARFFSGDYPAITTRPTLFIEFYVP